MYLLACPFLYLQNQWIVFSVFDSDHSMSLLYKDSPDYIRPALIIQDTLLFLINLNHICQVSFTFWGKIHRFWIFDCEDLWKTTTNNIYPIARNQMFYPWNQAQVNKSQSVILSLLMYHLSNLYLDWPLILNCHPYTHYLHLIFNLL